MLSISFRIREQLNARCRIGIGYVTAARFCEEIEGREGLMRDDEAEILELLRPLLRKDDFIQPDLIGLEKYQGILNRRKREPCDLFERVLAEMFIAPSGQVYICCADLGVTSNLGNVNHQAIRGIWNLLYVNGAPSLRSITITGAISPRSSRVRRMKRPERLGCRMERLFLIPYGVDARRFSAEVKSRREEIRNELGIPKEAKVILTVAALKREQKRIDYVIREVSQCEEPVWFLAAGQRTNENGPSRRRCGETSSRAMAFCELAP